MSRTQNKARLCQLDGREQKVSALTWSDDVRPSWLAGAFSQPCQPRGAAEEFFLFFLEASHHVCLVTGSLFGDKSIVRRGLFVPSCRWSGLLLQNPTRDLAGKLAKASVLVDVLCE